MVVVGICGLGASLGCGGYGTEPQMELGCLNARRSYVLQHYDIVQTATVVKGSEVVIGILRTHTHSLVRSWARLDPEGLWKGETHLLALTDA